MLLLILYCNTGQTRAAIIRQHQHRWEGSRALELGAHQHWQAPNGHHSLYLINSFVTLFPTIIIHHPSPLKIAVKLLTLLRHIRGSRIQISARRSTIVTEVLHGYPQSLQINTRILPCITQGLLSSTSFVIHENLTIRYNRTLCLK
jgi:hypothetical protein